MKPWRLKAFRRPKVPFLRSGQGQSRQSHGHAMDICTSLKPTAYPTTYKILQACLSRPCSSMSSFCGSGTREIVDEDANCESKSMNLLKRFWTSHSWWFSRTRMAYHVAPSKSELWSTWIWTLMATALSPPFETLDYCCGHMWFLKHLAKCLLGTFGSVCIFSTHVYYEIHIRIAVLGSPQFWYVFWEKKPLDI